MKRPKILSIATLVLAATLVHEVAMAAPGSLNELLEQTRSIRTREAQMNKEREAKFLAERDKQQDMLKAAKAELAALKARSESLSASFDSNEKELTELQDQLTARSGNLGEMFGVVRQVANDLSSVVHNSIITAQYPDREEFISKLSQTKALPSIEDLQRFWFELQREMTETGNVVRFKTKIVTPGGEPLSTSVVRVGSFSASANGQYLAYIPSQKELAIMARQPGKEFEAAAQRLEKASSGYEDAYVDPTRGVMLSIYAQRPNFIERIKNGEAVNYIILAVGFIGAGLALYQLLYLTAVRHKVRNQLRFPDDPGQDNPLGRVLATFKGDAERVEADAETVELRIAESVLKEVPRLERFQSFLKLAVAAGPLLGLIGTVMGMIITFQSITESGSSDPKLMAHGISTAMIATLLGLGIAVPLLFANAWLSSISRYIVQILDEQSTGLLASRLEKQRMVEEERRAA